MTIKSEVSSEGRLRQHSLLSWTVDQEGELVRLAGPLVDEDEPSASETTPVFERVSQLLENAIDPLLLNSLHEVVLDTGESRQFTLPFRDRTHLLTMVPVRGSDGTLEGTAGWLQEDDSDRSTGEGPREEPPFLLVSRDLIVQEASPRIQKVVGDEQPLVHRPLEEIVELSVAPDEVLERLDNRGEAVEVTGRLSTVEGDPLKIRCSIRRGTRASDGVRVEFSDLPEFKKEPDQNHENRSSPRRKREPNQPPGDFLERAGDLGFGFFVLDLGEDRVEWVSGIKPVLGLGPEDVDDWCRGFRRLVPEAERDRLERDFNRALEAGEPLTGTYRLRSGRQDHRWIELRSRIQTDDAGDPVRMLGAMVDITERVGLDASMEADRKRLDLAQQPGTFGFWSLSVSDHEFDWSEGMYRIHGLHPDEPEPDLSSLVEEMYAGEPGEQLLDSINRAVEQGEELNLELRFRHPFGDERFVQLRGAPRRDPSGEILDLVGICRDITDRKRAEEQVERQAEFLEAINNRMPGVAFQFKVAPDGSYSYPYVSEGYEELSGVPAGEARDEFEQALKTIHPDDRTRVMESIESAVETNSFWELEYRYRLPDGEVRWTLGSSTPEEKEDGSIVWSGVLIDITKRKQQQEKIRRSERQFRQMAETIREGFWLSSVDPRQFIYVNPRFEDMFGTSLSELQENPMSWLETVVSEDRERVKRAVAEDQDRGTCDETYRIAGSDGDVRWIRERAYPITDKNGDVYRIAGVTRDVTDDRRKDRELQQQEERFRVMYEESPQPLWEEDRSDVLKQLRSLKEKGVSDLEEFLTDRPDRVRDLVGEIKVRSVNNALLDLVGAETVEEIRENLESILTPETTESLPEEWSSLMEGNTTYSAERTIRTLDGDSRNVVVEVKILSSSQDDWSRVYVSCSDVTARNRIQEQLSRSETQFRQMAESIDQVFWLIDHETGEALYVNQAFEEIWGLSPEQFMDDPLCYLDRVHPDDRQRVKESRELYETGRYDIEYRLLQPDGTITWVRVRAYPIENADGEVYRIAGVVTDITDTKQLERQLSEGAIHDPLTGLPNRALFINQLEQSLTRVTSSREGGEFGLLYLDLDRFKLVNDRHGHLVGDELLKQIARMLVETVRETDTVARLSGDEFVIILEDSDTLEDLSEVCEKLLARFEEPVELGGEFIPVEFSLGAVLSDPSYEEPRRMLNDADRAMYRAKRKGGDRYVLLSDDLRSRWKQESRLKQYIQRDVEARDLVVSFQPVVSLKTDRIEALSVQPGWRHDEVGLFSNHQVFSTLSDPDRVKTLIEHLIDNVRRAREGWPEGVDVPLLLSLPANLLLSSPVSGPIRERFRGATGWCLGLREEDLRLHRGNNRNALDNLLEDGLDLFLDEVRGDILDFPRWLLRSFTYLRTHPDLLPSPEGEPDALVQLLDLCNERSVRLIANRIEHGHQSLALRSMGVPLGQGSHIASPDSAERVRVMLEETAGLTY